MAKQKTRQGKPIGLSHNQLCQHCGKKVRNFIQLETGYLVEHWWSKEICSTVKAPTVAEKLAWEQLKKHKFIVRKVMNEPA